MGENNPQEINTRQAIEHIWNVSNYVDLPREFSAPTKDLFELLEHRRTRRSFKKAIEQKILSSLLWYAQRHTGLFPNNQERVTTPIPTFGGLASVRTFVIQPDLSSWIYEPESHRAGAINCSQEKTNLIRQEVNNFFDLAQGSLLLFAASRQLVTSYYDEPDNLILRESGILTGTLALLAEAYNCSFCPLGTRAENWVFTLLNTTEEIVIPCGAAVVGYR